VVTQGHRNQHVPIRHLRLPLNVLWQLYGPISYRFQDKRRFQSKIANGPVYFAVLHPDKGVLLGFPGIGYQRLVSKTRIMGLPGRERCLMISSAVWIQYSTRTWRTDGRMDTGRQQRPR